MKSGELLAGQRMSVGRILWKRLGNQSDADQAHRAPNRAAEIAAEHCRLNLQTNDALDLFAAHVDQPPKQGTPDDWQNWLRDVEAFGATAINLTTRLGAYDNNQDVVDARIVDIEAGIFQARVLASRAQA